MYTFNGINKAVRPESYRDEWDDDHLVAEANEDFKRHLQNPFRYYHHPQLSKKITIIPYSINVLETDLHCNNDDCVNSLVVWIGQA